MTPITSGSADVVAQLIISQQDDPFFADVIREIVTRAKLKFEGLGRVFELSKELSDYWCEVRTQEELVWSIEAEGELANRERADLSWMHDQYRDMQIEFNRSRYAFLEQLRPDQ